MAQNLTDNWQIDKILTENWHLPPPPSRLSKEMKDASDISDTYLIIAYQSLLRIFI